MKFTNVLLCSISKIVVKFESNVFILGRTEFFAESQIKKYFFFHAVLNIPVKIYLRRIRLNFFRFFLLQDSGVWKRLRGIIFKKFVFLSVIINDLTFYWLRELNAHFSQSSQLWIYLFVWGCVCVCINWCRDQIIPVKYLQWTWLEPGLAWFIVNDQPDPYII